ncbi:hypothetical protein [Corynebacterium heidelbergense]|uniref:Uncharacterized protein n=1 Tax=Corynebacterium heidelbergense TaxID=2055947 RepID=A0A364VE12_9CORY|nr:hypothetical protein [Corynebacterium heidelbergense]RAV34883.1 hypothetical protein CWC39_00660 [Corynebacterium heidelbergense]WCZ36019.1 hypothetical protein CHEID_02260 [Corynebacterium heidelbergense]
MTEPLNPVEIESHIRELVNRIAKGIGVFSKRYAAFLEADRAFDRAYAQNYKDAEGSIKDREYEADLLTMGEREARDVADIAFKHADKLLKALDLELRAYQSIGASVRAMYGNAGRT